MSSQILCASVPSSKRHCTTIAIKGNTATNNYNTKTSKKGITASNIVERNVKTTRKEKTFQNSGKGHNELLEISNPMVETRVATNAV
jgi:hypothetical protein